jgi:hypothetical protein
VQPGRRAYSGVPSKEPNLRKPGDDPGQPERPALASAAPQPGEKQPGGMIEDDHDEALPGTAALPTDDRVLRFLDACREVQTQAAGLWRDGAITAKARDMLSELRVNLLALRRQLLAPASEDGPQAPGPTSTPSTNPLAPHSPPPLEKQQGASKAAAPPGRRPLPSRPK